MFDQRNFNSTIDSITRAFTQPVSLANIEVGAILANTPMSSRGNRAYLTSVKRREKSHPKSLIFSYFMTIKPLSHSQKYLLNKIMQEL